MKNNRAIYIGKQDFYEWTLSEGGKDLLMPQLLKGTIKLIDKNKDSVHCCRVECYVRDELKAFDFYVKKDEINDTLEKLMEWALENENYETCSKIKVLESKVEKLT
tara:strand:- start:2073 stop:2390 length:318 start_codon:yes stop_codon:yes gene_type:complete